MDDHDSSDRSLPVILKSRSRQKTVVIDSSHVSLASTDTTGGLRQSIDKSMDRLRSYGSLDGGDRKPSMDVGKRISNFMHRKKKGKSKKARDNDDGLGIEMDRGRSHAPVTAGEGLLYPESANRNSIDGDAQSWTRSHSGSRDSSLLTDDSDEEDASKPSLVSRPSHAAYLTLSSPLIDAETQPLFEAQAEVTTLHGVGTPSHDLETTIEAAPPLAYIFQDPGPPTQQITRKELGSLAGGLAPRPRFSGQAIDSASDTPYTIVTPPSPIEPQPPSPRKSPLSLGSLRSTSNTSPRTVQLSGTRRGRPGTGSGKFNFPSILSTTLEEAKTPGGSLTSPLSNSNTGFFSSLFSTTQNAINQFTDTINNSTPGHQRSRSGTWPNDSDNLNAKESGTNTLEAEEVSPTGTPAIQIEPTVATLGSGNLSLSHLGITEDSSSDSMLPKPDVPHGSGRSRARSIAQSVTAVSKAEEVSAAEAVSAAYTERPTAENSTALVVMDTTVTSERPRSIASVVGSTTTGEITPPRVSPNDIEGGSIQRSGSVRSRISAKAKRHRGSSVVTGSAIAAALSVSHAALGNPAAPSEMRQSLFGTKRNKDFHQLFRSVPEEDTLIEDFSAALQRDILLQGRLYISERHICFASNILGWVTNVVMNFDEIISMEKRMTAKIFPNAIHIQTLHAKHFFASLLNREVTYDLLLAQWRIGRPNIKASATGHELDESGVTHKIDTLASIGGSSSGSDEYSDSEDEEDGSSSDNGDAQFVEAGEVIDMSKPQHKVSVNGGSPSAPAGVGSPPVLLDFPGPVTHAPTDCEDQASHLEKQVMDTTIPAPLGRVYSMMFGPASGQVMRKFLIDDQKSGDLQMEDDKKGMGEEVKTFSYSFIKQLGGSIGPKQTKCLVTQTLDHFDLEKAVSVTSSTQTPDVPSGNAFVTKTKYCLSWGPANSTRFLMSTSVEWSGKSWLKGAIEKGASDGQVQYAKDITNFFKAQVSSSGAPKSALGRPRSKNKGRKKRSGTDVTDVGTSKTRSRGNSPTSTGWGFLRPVQPILDIIGSLVNPSIVLAVLLTVVTLLWVRSAYFTRSHRSVVGSGTRAQRTVAYEDLWRREESDLWSWLEDRMGLDGLTGVADTHDQRDGDTAARRRLQLQSREMESRLDEDGDGNGDSDERKIAEAIRVTQENLDALKLAKERKAAGKAGGVRKKA